jgi:hypothetical protein
MIPVFVLGRRNTQRNVADRIGEAAVPPPLDSEAWTR